MGAKHLTGEEIDYIKSLIREGLEYKEIARRVKRNDSTISRIGISIGIIKRRVNGKSPAAPEGKRDTEEKTLENFAGPEVKNLPAPVPARLPPRPSQGPGLEEKDGRFNISVSLAPEIVLDQMITRGMLTPFDVITHALTYLRDEDGKIAAPDQIRVIAITTGANI
jgi:hypothetical protein